MLEGSAQFEGEQLQQMEVMDEGYEDGGDRYYDIDQIEFYSQTSQQVQYNFFHIEGQHQAHQNIQWKKPLYVEQKEEQPNNICKVCYNQCQKHEQIYFGQCFHSFCSDCIQSHVQRGITDFKVIKCLEEGCQEIIQMMSPYIAILTIELQEKYYKILINDNMRKTRQLKLCSIDKCNGFLNTQSKTFECVLCRASHCRKCLSPLSLCFCNGENVMARYLQQNYGFRKCSNCQMMVQKKSGCKHIKCLCEHEFCYVCGQAWSLRHFCPKKGEGDGSERRGERIQ